jgi:hypothetical protein
MSTTACLHGYRCGVGVKYVNGMYKIAEVRNVYKEIQRYKG